MHENKTKNRSFHRSALQGSVSFLAIIASLQVAFAQDTGSAPPIPDVSVTVPQASTRDQALQNDGTAAQGYRADLVATPGFFDQTKTLDLPYSFSVAPQDLITSVQAPSAEQVLTMMPTVQVTLSENSGYGIRYQSRGFAESTAFDGLIGGQGNLGPIPIEDKERVENISGLFGFLYGPQAYNIGGVVNYVTKRPTATPLAEVTVGDRGGGSGYIHGDFSGPIAGLSGVSYRLNIVGQGLGDNAIENQQIRKGLISGAIDVKVTDTTVLQFDYAHQDYKIWAPTLSWSLTGLTFPAPDVSHTGAPSFSYQDWIGNWGSARFRSDPTDFLTLRGGFRYSDTENSQVYASNNAVATDGSYSQFLNKALGYENVDYGADVYADLKLNPLGIKNTFTTGYSNYNNVLNAPASNSAIANAPGFNVFNVVGNASAEANAAATASNLSPNSIGPNLHYYYFTFESLPFVDKIEFNDALSVIAGGNYTRITDREYDSTLGDPTTGALTSRYETQKVTPSASIMFKPIPSIMTYFTYQEGLTEGGIASQTFNGLPVSNPGPAPAQVAKQYELGAKATIDKLLVTLALFDLTQATTLYSLNSSGTAYTYAADGREEHRGVELGVSGKLTNNITLYGGVTAMTTKITSLPSDPLVVGENPAGVSNVMAKLYGEYSFDQVPGLVLSGGIQYYSKQLITNVDAGTGPLNYTSGYAVGSVGARYKFKVYDRDTTVALNIDNVTNTRYWQNPVYGLPGEPLTVRFSGSVRF